MANNNINPEIIIVNTNHALKANIANIIYPRNIKNEAKDSITKATLCSKSKLFQ